MSSIAINQWNLLPHRSVGKEEKAEIFITDLDEPPNVQFSLASLFAQEGYEITSNLAYNFTVNTSVDARPRPRQHARSSHSVRFYKC